MSMNEAQAKELNMMRDTYCRRSYIPELAKRCGEGMLDNRIAQYKKPTLLDRIKDFIGR